MFTALIARSAAAPDDVRPAGTLLPTTQRAENKHRYSRASLLGTGIDSLPATTEHDTHETEDRSILYLSVLMFLIMVLPAFVLIAYLIMNPDAFMFEITPQRDFSSWVPGQSF
jgi:hypothetical protein